MRMRRTKCKACMCELKQTIVNFLRTTKTATVDNLIVRACVCACVSTQHSICTTIYHIRHLAYPYFSVPKFRESSDWKNLSAHIRSILSFIVFNRALSSHLCLFYWNYSNSLVCWIGYIIYYLLFPQSQCSPLWPSYGCYCFEVFSISTVLFLLVLFVYLFVFFNLLLFVHMFGPSWKWDGASQRVGRGNFQTARQTELYGQSCWHRPQLTELHLSRG